MPRTYDWKRSRHRLTNPNYATRRPGITHPKKSTRPCQRKGLWSCGLPVKKNAPTAKKAGKWFQGHDESECHHKKKDEAEAALQAIKEKRERTGKGRQATQSEKKAFAAGALVKGPAAARRLVRVAAGDDEYPKSLPASSPHAIAFSAAAVLDQRHVRHGTVDTAAQLHVCRGTHDQSINQLLFLQKQNLATAIYLFGLGTLLTGLGLKHMRCCRARRAS